jgi:hypothetical protein
MLPIFIRQKSSKLGSLRLLSFYFIYHSMQLSIQGFKKNVFFIFALLFMKKNGTNSALKSTLFELHIT